eukprot:CAMPEP_0197180798 /NCGR_PEP_ID=MMETSP1423-20130617/5282_1 /TAXON_ID=476441 /ORGANISM="Pseudo-nitzschia heimii, Strain UNC1101" /LENGTH=1364 /DNA_ID=CAMNT_0042630923 /DNA_START=226 /DNA_END=4320 /DNA_ORIENTATION=-
MILDLQPWRKKDRFGSRETMVVSALLLVLLVNYCEASDDINISTPEPLPIHRKQKLRRLDQDRFANPYLFLGNEFVNPTKHPILFVPPDAGRRAPPGFDKIYETNRDNDDNNDFSGYPISRIGFDEPTPAAAPVVIDRHREFPTLDPTIEEDDDYSVVVLDDLVPWDLTEDTAAVPMQPTPFPTAEGLVVRDVNDDYYVAVVLEDDVPWDDKVVAEVAKDKFEQIINGNYNSSIDDDIEYDDDYVDENFPTSSPTITSSPTSSPKPTPLASASPTGEPSISPTLAPSTFPSDYPSFVPTNGPSQTPSVSPTHSCHDVDAYRSPIGRFGLGCSDHLNTNCLDWRHLLNMTELETLVRSCPETCDIECGSFKLFSAPVSFRITRVSGFMDQADVNALSEFAISYLEDFVQDYIAPSLKELPNVVDDTKSNVDGNRVGDEGSRSNDSDDESMNDDEAKDGDDFLNDDLVEGASVTFYIEVAELTAQNLVEIILPEPVSSRSDLMGEEEEGEEGEEQSEIGSEIEPKPAQNTTSSINAETESGIIVNNNENPNPFRRKRLLRGRNLQELQRTKQQSSGGLSIIETDKALDVIVTFEGFTIGMNPETMPTLLVYGIDSIAFTRELQQSGIGFFSEAVVSSAMGTEEEDLLDEGDLLDGENKGNSRFSVVVSYLVPILVIGFAIGSLFYHKCYIKGRLGPRYKRHRQIAIERAQIGGMTVAPMVASASNNSIVADTSNDERSTGGYFNFRQEAATSFSTDDERIDSNKEEGGKSAFSRLITALNLNLSLTKSKDSIDEDVKKVEESSSDSDSNGDIRKPHKQSKEDDDPLVSPFSGDIDKKEAVLADNHNFKAYASVLPPMIVIDNIDSAGVDCITPVAMATNTRTENNTSVQDSSVRSSSTPIEELDAFASEFRKKLLRSSTISTDVNDPNVNGSFYGMYSSSALDSDFNDESENLVIRSIVSDEWDGDDLFSPIPSNITTTEDGDEFGGDLVSEPGRSSTSEATEDDDDSLSKSPMSTSIESGKKKRVYGTLGGTSGNPATIPNIDTNLSSSSMTAERNRDGKPDVTSPRNRAELPPIRPPTPERGSSLRRNVDVFIEKNPTGNEQQHKRPFLPKAGSSIPTNPSSRALTGNSSNSSIDAKGHMRKTSVDTVTDLRLIKNNSSISALSTDDLGIGSSKSEGSSYKSIIDTIRLEFEGPREGNWGLILESSSKIGTRIYVVKDYSPLFGLVQRGDKLLEIDGKNISKSNLTDVTKLLKGKSSSYPYHRPTSATMPIVVSRSSKKSPTYNSASSDSKNRHHRDPHYADIDHKRNNSICSSAGSSSSRIVEDVDDDGIYFEDRDDVYHEDQYHHNYIPYNSPFDYDSSNEI